MSNTAIIPTYTKYNQEIPYEPRGHVSTLDWFELAKAARSRMTTYCHDTDRWRGERRAFYTCLQNMNVSTSDLLD